MGRMLFGATRFRLLRPLVCPLLIGCCLVSGCGSGGGAASGGRPTPSVVACDLVTTADVEAVSGEPATGGDEIVGDEADITVCQYSAVLVRFSPHLGSANAALNRPDGSTQVPGLGDAAYTYPDTTAGVVQHVLSVVVGNAQLYMVSMDLDVDQLVELARRGLARLQ